MNFSFSITPCSCSFNPLVFQWPPYMSMDKRRDYMENRLLGRRLNQERTKHVAGFCYALVSDGRCLRPRWAVHVIWIFSPGTQLQHRLYPSPIQCPDKKCPRRRIRFSAARSFSPVDKREITTGWHWWLINVRECADLQRTHARGSDIILYYAIYNLLRWQFADRNEWPNRIYN